MLQCKNDGVPVAVHLSACEEPYDQQLQRAADSHLQNTGKRLAVLLVTNPDNPTGTVYSKTHLLQMLTWCVKNKVHLIRCAPNVTSQLSQLAYLSILHTHGMARLRCPSLHAHHDHTHLCGCHVLTSVKWMCSSFRTKCSDRHQADTV